MIPKNFIELVSLMFSLRIVICTPSDVILDLWKIMKCVFFRFRVSLFSLIQISPFSSSSFNNWHTFLYDWPSINTLVSSANIIVNIVQKPYRSH